MKSSAHKPVNPIRLIHEETELYDWCGTKLDTLETFKDPYPQAYIAAAFDANAKNGKAEIDEGVAFAMHYLPPFLWNERAIYNFADWHNAVDPDHPPTSQEDTTRLFQKALNTASSHFTDYYDNVQEGKRLLGSLSREFGHHGLAERVHARMDKRRAERHVRQNQLTDELALMPEWMQVLVHKTGSYVFAFDKAHSESSGHANTSDLPLPMSIYVNPNVLKDPDRTELVETLREEWLHSLEIMAYMQDPKRNEPDSLQTRWQSAAATLIKAIDADPKNHPALKLIRRSESHGGSLMAKDCIPYPNLRASELLVDICDAEVFLLKKKQFSAAKTERILRKRFGDEVYDISHEIIGRLCDEAQRVLSDETSPAQALRFREKWQKNPLCHDIDLTLLPGYNPAQFRQHGAHAAAM